MRRRRFLRTSAALAASLPLGLLFRRRARADEYGPLVDDPDGILDLPEGFTYRILQRRGDVMSDGYLTPGAPDGMGCFVGPTAGTIVLMRNHELSSASGSPYSAGQSPPPEAYDASAYGGVTRLVLRSDDFSLVSSNLVLVGTVRNCAGGLSPWGWLSCEETFSTGHGYTFVCPIDAETVQPAAKVVGYGRMNHEAATVDPVTRIAYLTEDRGDSSFYRFVPDDPEFPFIGTLQALRIVGAPKYDTASGLEVGDELTIDWVDVGNPDPAIDDLRQRAQNAGAAIFRRGEGLWLHQGVIYFSCTSGGPVGGGQIFALRPNANHSGGTLELIAQSTDRNVLDMPDNITVAPWGDVLMAEDGDGTDYLRGLTPEGAIYDFARCRLDSELAGVCLSPDGRALFVNIQSAGLTLVIEGPFPEFDPGVGEPTSDGGVPNADAGSSGPDLLYGGIGSPDPGAMPPMEGTPASSGGCSATSTPAESATLLGGLALATAALMRRRAPRNERTEDAPNDE